MFALQQSFRSAALLAGRLAVATALVAGAAMALAQPASVRYPITGEQRRTADEVVFDNEKLVLFHKSPTKIR